jgi:hypothetical protein
MRHSVRDFTIDLIILQLKIGYPFEVVKHIWNGSSQLVVAQVHRFNVPQVLKVASNGTRQFVVVQTNVLCRRFIQ